MTEKNDTVKLEHPKFGSVPIEICVSVGMARPKIRELLALSINSTIDLDRGINDPVELIANGKLVARGNLEEKIDAENSNLSVRITELIDQIKL